MKSPTLRPRETRTEEAAERASPASSLCRLKARAPGLAVTVDLEEWFHVCGVDSRPPEEWESLPSNVERSTEKLFGILEQADAKVTVFVLGWLVGRKRPLLERLARAGHEIASHAMLHRRLDELPLGERRAEVRQSKQLLEDAIGAPVVGFRAPEWSIRSTDDPTLRILAEEGYLYDASLTRVPGLGHRGNPAGPVRVTWSDGESISEVPPLTAALFGISFPVGGSWMGRMLPLPAITGALERSRLRGEPALLTVHPWEFDPAHPADRFGLATRLMHHAGLVSAEGRLSELLGLAAGDVRPLREVVAAMEESTRVVGLD